MGKYINAHCRICDEGYHRCNCQSEGNWRKVTCSAEHYQIFCVIRDYVNEVIDANKADSLLSKMDLSEKDSFRENVKEVLADIASNKTKVEVPKQDVTQKAVESQKATEPVKKAENTQQKSTSKPNQHSKKQPTWKK